MWFFWRKSKKPSLQQGVEKLDAILRGLHESKRAFVESKPAAGRVFSPSEQWSKKYLSQGIGPESALAEPIACFDDGTCLPLRNELMRELSVRSADDCHCADKTAAPNVSTMADIGSVRMRHPFAPGKPKRSWLGKLLLG